MDKDVIEQFCKKLQTIAKPAQIESAVPFLNQYGFEVQALLGAGTYGVMILAKKLLDSSKVAIKQIIFEDTDELMDCMKQSQCLMNIKSPFILELGEIICNEKENQLFFISEYCPAGNLNTYLEQNNNNLADLQITQAFTGILKGLLTLREHDLIHGDLKPENILLSSSGNPLIVDFGLASQFIEKKKAPASSCREPSFYIPMEQEVLQKIVPETDYYSAGMLLYRLCGCNDPVEMFQMKSGIFPQISLKYHSELLRLAFSMMSTDQHQRVSPNQILTLLQQLTLSQINNINVTNAILEVGQNKHAPPESVAKPIASIPYLLAPPCIAAKNKQDPFTYDADQDGDQDLPKLDPYEFKNGSVYVGQWKDGNRHGRGEIYYKDGSFYEGYWRNGIPQGKGRIIHQDGDIYLGHWEEGKAKGQGTYFTANGTIYDGEWLNDTQHGKGLETWTSGDMYKGYYFEGKKQGIGKFSWADGSSYSGQFQSNNIDGVGTYLWSDGRKYVGEWKNNQMNGNGVYSWADGRKYQGEYLDDKKEGYGVFTWPDGREYAGKWKAGKQHGKGIYSDGQGQMKKGEWEDGKRIKWINDQE